MSTDQEISDIVKKYLNLNCWHECMPKLNDQVKKFEVRDTDVFLLGYPKSGKTLSSLPSICEGTTWSQEMIWLIANDLDYEGAKNLIYMRFPLIEYNGNAPAFRTAVSSDSDLDFNSVEWLNNTMINPRCIKSHLSPEFLPEELLTREKKPKIIYIARNVKDVCLSSHYFSKNLLKNFSGNFEEYCKIFTSDAAFPVGNYWDGVLYFWERRNEPHILFIKYEEMKSNLLKVIQTVAKFLNKTLTEEQEMQLIKWLDFDSMKNNPAVNFIDTFGQSGFMRTGEIGEHKKKMTPEISTKFDIWIKNCLKDSDYKM